MFTDLNEEEVALLFYWMMIDRFCGSQLEMGENAHLGAVCE